MTCWVSQAGLMPVPQEQKPMKTLITAATAALLMTTTVHAGKWTGEVYSNWVYRYFPTNDDGNAMCVIFAGFMTGNVAGFVQVKYTQPEGVFLQIIKTDWRIADDESVPYVIKLPDRDTGNIPRVWGDARALNRPTQTGTTLHMDINADLVEGFLKSFGDAEKMVISFPQGNERDWVINMAGSRKAARIFADCLLRVAYMGTQPKVAPPKSVPR
jgi:hypothetical protein